MRSAFIYKHNFFLKKMYCKFTHTKLLCGSERAVSSVVGPHDAKAARQHSSLLARRLRLSLQMGWVETSLMVWFLLWTYLSWMQMGQCY
jgi:hypothetical protein